MYSIIAPANIGSFTSSFPIWIPFIYFYCLIAVARTSNTTLNKSGENEQPCLVPDLRINAFSFSLLSMMLAVGLSYILKYVPSIPILVGGFIFYSYFFNRFIYLFIFGCIGSSLPCAGFL